MTTTFNVAPPQAVATLIMGVIILSLLALCVRMFLMDASQAWRGWTLVTSGAATLVLATTFVYLLWGAFHSTVTIERDSVCLQVPIYSTTVPLNSIDVERAEVLDLAKCSTLKPSLRTNGLGVPGYRLGHFRLGNGARARLAVTTPSGVVHIPFGERSALLISVERPEEFLAALRSAAAT